MSEIAKDQSFPRDPDRTDVGVIGGTWTNTVSGVIWDYIGRYNIKAEKVMSIGHVWKRRVSSVSEQVQTDYTQNDSTAKDYIKNRPFYEYVIRNSVLADICSEVTASGGHWVSKDGAIGIGLNVGDSSTRVVIYIDSPISIGDSLQVVLNGNSYTCSVEDYSSFSIKGAIGFGDSSLFTSGTVSTYGFAVALFPTAFFDELDQTKPYVVFIAVVPGSTAPTEFKIIGDAKKIVKIDEKYLPDNIATVGMIQNVSEQANTAKSTADTAKSTADTAKSTANTAKTTADNAQSTANNAKTTANNAKTTADAAKTTANNANSMATNAQSMASVAQTTAHNAKTTADDAQSMATNAQTIANNAKAAADDAYPRAGASELRLKSNNSGLSGNMLFSGKPNEPIYCRVDRCSASNASAPARFVFKPNGATSMQVEGINVLQMKSSSGKKFNITVDDSGTISATEATS